MKQKKKHRLFQGGFAATLAMAFLAIFAIPAISSVIFLSSGKSAAVKEIEKNDKTIINAIHSYVDKEVFQTAPIAALLTNNAALKEFFQCVREEMPHGERVIEAYKLAEVLKQIIVENPLAEEIYVSLDNTGEAVSSVMFEEKERFFEKFYKNTDLTYKKWTEALKKRNYGQYIIVNDKSGKYIDFFYSTSYFEEKPGVSATIVIRMSEKYFTDYISKTYDFALKQIKIIDKNNNTVLDFGENILNDISYEKIGNYAQNQRTEEYLLTSLKASNNWKYVLVTDSAMIGQKIYFNKLISLLSIISYLLALAVFMFVFIVKNFLPVKRIFSLINSEVKDKYKILEDIIGEYGTYKSYFEKYKKENNEEQKEQFFNNLVSFSQTKDGLLQKAQNAGIDFVSDVFCVLIIDIYNFERLFEPEQIDDAEKYKSAGFIIKNIFEEVFKTLGYAYTFMKNDKVCCVLNISDEQTDKKESVLSALQCAKQVIGEHFDMFFSISISLFHTGIENVLKAYGEAEAISEKNSFFRNKDITFYDEIYQKNQYREIDDEIIESFISLVQTGNSEKAKELFKSFAEVVISSSADVRDEFKLFAIRMINAIESASDAAAEKPKELYALINKILEFETYEKCIGHFEALIDYTCSATAEKNREEGGDENLPAVKSEQIVAKIKDYIAEHYTDQSICLTGIGDYFNYAPYYIARVFKNVTGEDLPGYINRYRITKAKEFLHENSKIPIASLYSMVGFGSERTFVRAFMRYENISVGQYKKLIKKSVSDNE